MKPPKPKRWSEMTLAEQRIAPRVIKAMSALNVWLHRKSGGRLGGKFLGGEPVLLLTTVGRRSGEPRTTPLLYLEDGERLVVVASVGGAPQNPLWYGNLVAEPRVEVEIARKREVRRARTASDEERTALWPRLCAMYPSYQDYQDVTDRRIPVVILERELV